MQTIKVEAYSAAEFATKLQEAFEQGYRLDLETNENYPTSFGSYFHAGLVKKEAGEAKEQNKGKTRKQGLEG